MKDKSIMFSVDYNSEIERNVTTRERKGKSNWDVMHQRNFSLAFRVNNLGGMIRPSPTFISMNRAPSPPTNPTLLHL